LDYNREELAATFIANIALLNNAQKGVYDAVMGSVNTLLLAQCWWLRCRSFPTGRQTLVMPLDWKHSSSTEYNMP